jgi:hypothetical protein
MVVGNGKTVAYFGRFAFHFCWICVMLAEDDVNRSRI